MSIRSILPKLTEVLARVHPAGILELTLNTPKNLNSFGSTKYGELMEGFHYAKENQDIKAVVLSSTGRFFSAGGQIVEGAGMDGGGDGKAGEKPANPAQDYIDMLIDFPKLAVASVQGPSYGICVTMLPLFDLVYASPQTTLTTPFSRIGVSVEGCSSVTFPPIFGPSLTSRMLYLAETMPVDELKHTGFFADVLPQEGMAQAVVDSMSKKLEDLAPGSIIASKSMIRSAELRKKLHELNAAEMALVGERFKSQEHKDAMARFAAAKKAKDAKKAKA